MRVQLRRVGVGAAIIAVWLPGAAAAQVKTATLSALDYEEIRNLYGRYSLAFDAGDGQALAACYTPDGAFVTGDRRIEGRDKLVAQPRQPVAGRASMRHLPANIVIDPTQEGARGRAYVFVVNIEAGKPPAFMTAGLYEDVIVKAADGWRFKQRTFTPFSTAPTPPTSSRGPGSR